MAQFSVSAGLVPTYKIYKICQFVGLKKKEVTTIVCVFLRKAPTKKESSWITNKVKNETVKRDQLFKKWILQPNDYNRERYVKQRNRVTKVIRNAERDHNEKVLGENPNAKTLFGILKSTQKRNENQPANLPSAQVLYKFFTEIVPSLSAKIK